MTCWPAGWLQRTPGLVVAAGLLVACGAPGLDVGALSREPILTPPVEAVELGRSSEEGSGLGPGVAAVVEVAFAVQLSPEEAAQSWLEAYGRQYNLADPGSAGKLQVLGRNDDVGVSLAFGSSVVAIQGSPEDYQEPPVGATVVTIVLSGHLEGEGDYFGWNVDCRDCVRSHVDAVAVAGQLTRHGGRPARRGSVVLRRAACSLTRR